MGLIFLIVDSGGGWGRRDVRLDVDVDDELDGKRV